MSKVYRRGSLSSSRLLRDARKRVPQDKVGGLAMTRFIPPGLSRGLDGFCATSNLKSEITEFQIVRVAQKPASPRDKPGGGKNQHRVNPY